MSKQTAVLLFGGASSEHEISCLSASCWAEHLDSSHYDVYYVGITTCWSFNIIESRTGMLC